MHEQVWQVQAIKEALEDYESGNAVLVPHEQVMAEMDQLEAEIKADLSNEDYLERPGA